MFPRLLERWCDPRIILVAMNLDDDPALLRHAVAEARRSGARLLLVHVIPPAESEEASAGPPPILFLPSVESAAGALDYMALQIQWQGVLCEPVVLRGQPDEQIRALIRSHDVDRVFVACRAPARMALAQGTSLAEKLMATASVPVCVVGHQVIVDTRADPLPGRVLLPLSLRTTRYESVSFACGVARARRARLTLLHVIDPSSDDRQRTPDEARLRLAALAAAHDDLLWRPDISVREGNPASQIIEEAVCPFRDLIILGSSSAPFSFTGQNSILRRVIAEARCPVITFKPQATEARDATNVELPALRTAS